MFVSFLFRTANYLQFAPPPSGNQRIPAIPTPQEVAKAGIAATGHDEAANAATGHEEVVLAQQSPPVKAAAVHAPQSPSTKAAQSVAKEPAAKKSPPSIAMLRARLRQTQHLKRQARAEGRALPPNLNKRRFTSCVVFDDTYDWGMCTLDETNGEITDYCFCRQLHDI